jgi:hypothetical protein
MSGSWPDDGDVDGDVIAMGPEKPRRTWLRRTGAIGGRTRLVLAVAGACVLLAGGATVAVVRLTANGSADAALAELITEVTTVPVDATAAPISLPSGPPISPGMPISSATSTPSGAEVYLADGGSAGSAGSASSLPAEFAFPTPVSGPPLTAAGKPEVLYVGSEYCPYCVAENWALIVALSRFGTFSGLNTSRSAHFDNVPPIDGWTFYGSSYTSPYLSFVPVETRSNVLVVNAKTGKISNNSYRMLQRLTPAEESIFSRFDTMGQTPFLDFGGQATLLGSGISPETLVGKTWSQIAADLRHPHTPAGQEIRVSADVLTAEFCWLTGDRPAAACPK